MTHVCSFLVILRWDKLLPLRPTMDARIQDD